MNDERTLSAEDIEKAEDLKVDTMHVPEWGGSVCLRTLPADEYVALNDALLRLKADGTAAPAANDKALDTTYLMVGMHLATPKGERLYKDDATARAALSKRNPNVLIRIQQEIAARTNKASATAKNALGEAAATGASPTASPSASGT